MKAFKKILILALALCMMASMLALVSCNKDKGNDTDGTDGDGNSTETPTGDSYTITVVDGANTPVAGVKVMIDPGYKTYTSDQNGKITFETDKTGLKVAILSAPEGYEYSSNAVSFKKDSKELKLTVTKIEDEKVTYTVTVIDQNGDAVVGAGVQLCYNGTCLLPVNTNDSGVMTNSLTGGYEVSVLLTLPDGYSKEPVSGKYHAVIPEGETEITVTVTKN